MTTSETAQPAPEIVAHRGDPIGRIENTEPAIRAAVEAGASLVEIDVRVSADGIVVLLHDERTTRLWGLDAAVSDLTAEQLARLEADTPRSDAEAAGHAWIPTLEEGLRAAAPARLLIDLPDAASARAAVSAVQALLASVSLPAPAWCGDEAGLLAVREADPGAEIWLSREDAEMPSPDLLAALRPSTWNPEHIHVTAETVRAARALGLVTTCWTVDDPARAAELAQLGVSGIISNRAADLRAALAGGAA